MGKDGPPQVVDEDGDGGAAGAGASAGARRGAELTGAQKLDKVFDCPLCFNIGTVVAKINKERTFGELQCTVCRQKHKTVRGRAGLWAVAPGLTPGSA